MKTYVVDFVKTILKSTHNICFCVEITKNIKWMPLLSRGMAMAMIGWGITTGQPLWVILCCLPEKGRKAIEEIVEEMKERDR